MARIVRMEAKRLDYAVAGQFKFLKPDADGVARRPTVFLRLTDEDGWQGVGQSVPIPTWSDETPQSAMSTLAHHLGPALLGVDAEDLAAVHARMQAAIRPGFSTGQPICKAGVDLACWDLLGQRRGLPVAHLLGGEPKAQAITLSWTVASADLDVAQQQLEQGRARGYVNFNIKVGPPQDLAYDLKLAKLVREASPEGFLWADANTGYDPAQALEAAPRLAEVGVDVLESPLAPNRIRGYQRLRRLGALPILMDEGVLSPCEAEEFIELGMLDGIAMKPARSAGLEPSRRIINLLRERGLMVLGSGLTDPDVSLAASVHLYAWAGIDRPCALNGPQFLADWHSGQTIWPAGDRLSVPPTPGLGVSLSEAALEGLAVLAEGA